MGPNYGAPAEIIQDRQHGRLVDPQNSAAIAEALIDLLTHPDKANDMGRAGGDWVRKRYSYTSFRETLGKMLAEGHAGASDANTSDKGRKMAIANPILQALFVLWVLVVNFLYCIQFKGLLAARFAHLLYRWH